MFALYYFICGVGNAFDVIYAPGSKPHDALIKYSEIVLLKFANSIML